MRIPYQLNEMRMADPAFSHSLRSVDFSEYEWMEHIEEFDRETMKLIEEEWFYEQCLVEFLRSCEQRNDRTVVFDDGSCYLETDLMLDFLTNSLQENHQLSCSSLNPDAPAFVPKNES